VETVDAAFWSAIDAIVGSSEVVIDRPKGSHHPRFPSITYPVDYGYLADTKSMDGGGIDVWVGSLDSKKLVGIICTVDLEKRDSEMKIILGCTPEEIERAHHFLNAGEQMKGILIKRP
jgi:inorganic pyrophosphatase